MFIKPPGAFLVLAMLTALQNKFKLPSATNGSGKSLLLPVAEIVQIAWVRLMPLTMN